MTALRREARSAVIAFSGDAGRVSSGHGRAVTFGTTAAGAHMKKPSAHLCGDGLNQC